MRREKGRYKGERRRKEGERKGLLLKHSFLKVTLFMTSELNLEAALISDQHMLKKSFRNVSIGQWSLKAYN